MWCGSFLAYLIVGSRCNAAELRQSHDIYAKPSRHQLLHSGFSSHTISVMKTTMIAYHSVLGGASTSVIQPVLDLSNAVFGGPTGQVSTPHGSLKEWQSRLSENNAIIVYASNDKPDLQNPGKPVGFIFAHPRHVEPGDGLHIWLAGISPASRGGGIFHGMMQVLENHARKNNVLTLTVCTFPAKFETMYRILCKTGWTEVEKLDAGKVLLRKNLSAQDSKPHVQAQHLNESH